ncbi:hypothetical protein I4U23_022651 [Adineta vaga]|nr:hypothetical protein I4U23_022651 [Adineta vaga]
MNFFYWIFLFIINRFVHNEFVLPPNNINEYDSYGSLLAINEYLSIFAQNDKEQFTIIRNPFSNESIKCILPYRTIERSLTSLTHFIYNIIIGIKQTEHQLTFSYINENRRRDVFLSIVSLTSISNGCVSISNYISINITDFRMQEHSLVGMDPYGKRAYAIGIYYIICYDIETNYTSIINTEFVHKNENYFFPKSLIINENHFLFIVGQRFINIQFLSYLIVLNFTSIDNLTISSLTELSKYNFGSSSIDITRNSMISISLLDHIDLFIIGIPYLNMIMILSWKTFYINNEILILQNYIHPQKGILFGKSLVLLDNKTFAVLAYSLSTLPWSTSQIQIYSLDEFNSTPEIIYPNNQQILPILNYESLPYSILTIISYNSHLGILLNIGVVLLLSSSSPGYCSCQIEHDITTMEIYKSIECLPGTSRNTTSIGPCFICPLKRKNNGNSGIECELCLENETSLCFRGSLNEILLNDILSYDQVIPYPNSPDLVEFDDILLKNIFDLTTISSPQCLIKSSLFWTCLAIGFAFLLFLLINIFKYFPKFHRKEILFKRFFRHLDLIGEGESWLGGLMIFPILILLIFTIKFTISFTNLYPIENFSLKSSCESSMSNTKFTSGLQLLTIGQHEDEKPIFTMLDKQNLILRIDFIGTAFRCHHLIIEEDVRLNNFNCSYNENKTILSVSTLLSQHFITRQYDLIGPYFIGAIRICLSDLSRNENNQIYQLQKLDFCQLFSENNETLTMNGNMKIKLTKQVNRTIGYRDMDETIFSGIWIPTLTMERFSDKIVFEKNGEYQRYLSDRISFSIDISQSEFFMKNIQEPIARQTEIILHVILFSIIFLDLFGLICLGIKLTIRPLIKFIKQRFDFKKKTHL